jgi:cyclopropane fatty-acyl-phospholipid synthase-like methyltransferase
VSATEWSIGWWRDRHRKGYFPAMEQHRNWRLYDAMPEWFMDLAKPTAHDRALEIGCGYGEWMAPLSALVASVDGFDIHPNLVAQFKQGMAEFENARMRLGDGRTIPFEGPYSLIYSISVFQHMPRATVATYIDQSARLLGFEGRAVFHFRAADGDGPYSEDIYVNHSGDFSVGWTLEEVTETVRAAKLSITDHYAADHSLVVLARR